MLFCGRATTEKCTKMWNARAHGPCFAQYCSFWLPSPSWLLKLVIIFSTADYRHQINTAADVCLTFATQNLVRWEIFIILIFPCVTACYTLQSFLRTLAFNSPNLAPFTEKLACSNRVINVFFMIYSVYSIALKSVWFDIYQWKRVALRRLTPARCIQVGRDEKYEIRRRIFFYRLF